MSRRPVWTGLALAGLVAASCAGNPASTPQPATPPAAAAQAAETQPAPSPEAPVEGSPAAAADDVCARLPGANQAKIERYVTARCYERWRRFPPPVKATGRKVGGVDYSVHGLLQVWATPGAEAWRLKPAGTILDGEMIVGIEYDASQKRRRALSKVRQSTGSADGWFWSVTDLGAGDGSNGSFGPPTCLSCHASARAELTYKEGSSDAPWMPDPELPAPQAPPVTRHLPKPLAHPDQGFLDFFKRYAPEVRAIDRSEVEHFPPQSADHVPAPAFGGSRPFVTADQCIACHNAARRLSNSRPNMWYPDPEGTDPTYRNYSPYGEWSASINALSARDPVWHAQIESERFLRDPKLSDLTVTVCFSCHGPMGVRQQRTDTGNPNALFTLKQFYATPEKVAQGKVSAQDLEYGALARQGIGCAVCHHIEVDSLGVDPADLDPDNPHGHLNPSQLESYTAEFETSAAGLMYGPYSGNLELPMIQSLGIEVVGGPRAAPHLSESRLCGSCHVVLVPAIPADYPGDKNPLIDPEVPIAFEQVTYWEWRNSYFNDEDLSTGLPCQGCHMAPHRGGNGGLLRNRIANIESARFPPAPGRLPDDQISIGKLAPFPRHVLLGINPFVHQMYQQFPDVLGSELADPTVPRETLNPLLNADDWIADHARNDTVLVSILDAEETPTDLVVDVQVANYAGHKLPTGAGFRRAWIRFRVLDASGAELWASGRFNDYGALLEGTGPEVLPSEFADDPGDSQPHHQTIDREDQVQIYETRSLDEHGMLQTTVLGIIKEYKDNRILPIGWSPTGPNIYAMRPELPDGKGGHHDDPDYTNPDFTRYGADRVTYSVPLDAVTGWARIEADVYYQTIPPYYLRDRFRGGVDPDTGRLGRDTRRLLYIASHLDLSKSVAKSWSLRIGNTAVHRKGMP